jgi:hypothetical protein
MAQGHGIPGFLRTFPTSGQREEPRHEAVASFEF